MDPILITIEEALKRSGLTDAAASKLAVGHPSLIKNIKMPREGEKRYNLPALMKLAEVLDLEFYFGPRRETGPIEQVTLDGTEYASIALHDAFLSAGPGSDNHGSNIIDHLAFRRDWLRRLNVDPGKACLARVCGDSMFPTLSPNDMMLIDTRITEPPVRARSDKDKRRSSIYAFVQDGEARVKRIERPEPDLIMLLSDNPDYAPEALTGRQAAAFQIIGKVMWWGHTAAQ
jgi:phage repressor protein C with HTH and peptisase S24 domain